MADMSDGGGTHAHIDGGGSLVAVRACTKQQRPHGHAFLMRLQVALDGREMLHGGAVVWAYDSVDACGYGE